MGEEGLCVLRSQLLLGLSRVSAGRRRQGHEDSVPFMRQRPAPRTLKPRDLMGIYPEKPTLLFVAHVSWSTDQSWSFWLRT